MRGLTLSGLAVLTSWCMGEIVAANRHDAHLQHKHRQNRRAGGPPDNVEEGLYPTLLYLSKKVVVVSDGVTNTDMPAEYSTTIMIPGRARSVQATDTSHTIVTTSIAAPSIAAPTIVNKNNNNVPSPALSNNPSLVNPSSTTTTVAAGNPPPSQRVSTSDKPTNTNSPPSTGNGSGGKGLCWDKTAYDKLSSFGGKGITWHHNWRVFTPDIMKKEFAAILPPGMKYVPMLKAPVPGDEDAYNFHTFVDAMNAWTEPFDMVLTFNEPDIAKHDPVAAAQVYKDKIITPGFQGKFPIVAPAVLSDESIAIPWLKSFMAACTDCKFAYVASNYYQEDCQVGKSGEHMERLLKYVELLRGTSPKLAGLPLVLPEVGCRGASGPGVAEFQNAVKTELSKPENNVFRYAWFSAARVEGPEGAGSMITHPELAASY